MAKVNLSSPWSNYYKEINALFGLNPDINVVFDEENYVVKLYVDGEVKANAIEQILPQEKEFGNVTVTIQVIPANKTSKSRADLFEAAFRGNPAFSYIQTIEGPFTNPISYVVFKNAVVQYFTDNLGDIHGLRSTLYQEIAREIIGVDEEGIYFCTDVAEEDVNKE